MPKIHFVAEGLLLVAGDELKIKMKNLDFYFYGCSMSIYRGVAFVGNLKHKLQFMHQSLQL